MGATGLLGFGIPPEIEPVRDHKQGFVAKKKHLEKSRAALSESSVRFGEGQDFDKRTSSGVSGNWS